MKAILTLVVVAVAVFIILFRPGDIIAREWAFAAIGLLMGYWLKGKEAAQR